MQQVVWISVVLLNVVWISFFLTPNLDFSVFVQRRSISSSDETFMMEFCLQPDSDRKWTSAGPSASGPDGDISTVTERPDETQTFAMEFHLQPDSDRKWTSAGPSVSGPDGDISTVTERPVNRKKTQHEGSNSGDKFPTSAAPDPSTHQIDLLEPTYEQRLTLPEVTSTPIFSSSSKVALVTKIPEIPRNQKININRPKQEILCPYKPYERSPYPCCTEVYTKPIALKNLRSFFCNSCSFTLRAIVFLTVKDRLICMDPDRPWVIRAVEHLKKKSH